MTLYNITNTLWTQTFQQTTLLGVDWLVSIPIILISLALITRDMESWKSMAFVMAVAWSSVGIHVNAIILIITGIMFVIDTLSIQIITNIIGTTIDKSRELFQLSDQAIERKKQSDIKKGLIADPIAVESIQKMMTKQNAKAYGERQRAKTPYIIDMTTGKPTQDIQYLS